VVYDKVQLNQLANMTTASSCFMLTKYSFKNICYS